MKESKLRVSVTVIGIKKCCRKVERHYLEVGHHEVNADEGFLIEQGKATLMREMKTVQKASLSITPVQVEFDRGFRSESFRICDPNARNIPLTLEVAHA